MLMVTDGCANGVSHRHPFSSRFSSRRSTNTTPLTASFAKPTPPSVHSPSDPHTFHGLITRLRTVHHPSFPSFPNTKNRSSHLFFPPLFSLCTLALDGFARGEKLVYDRITQTLTLTNASRHRSRRLTARENE